MSGNWPWFGRPQPPVVADAQTADAAGLAAIHAASFERGWDIYEFEHLLADRMVVAHVARPGGRGSPTGFAMSRLVLDEAEIFTVAVAPAARRTGLATLLMQHHLARLAAAGIKKVFLEVAEDNVAARRLYDRHGFVEIGRRAAYYARKGGAAAAALVMERSLR
ncbi:GNAT family N-acetyltransferase [Labrys monachus]|uniref:Ribosomal-protein-alanine N-acetyltransferase n=1 Tax=Labrys monachus TaxID=217067 RepID=A0ABU0FCF8_9HYPH|nr:GNAT family N-acetyltransferase [Labrys monachus]MDQ0392303.1 ribosomal-protein-alanine N-acetyltransferase [Labrys monachus]